MAKYFDEFDGPEDLAKSFYDKSDIDRATMSPQEMHEFIKTATRQETTDPETGYAVISYVNEETGRVLIYDVVTPQSR